MEEMLVVTMIPGSKLDFSVLLYLLTRLVTCLGKMELSLFTRRQGCKSSFKKKKMRGMWCLPKKKVYRFKTMKSEEK